MTRVEAPRSGKTTFHRDATVTIWDVYAQAWVRGTLGVRLLATLPVAERKRVERHCGG